ncbi:MAG: hypothetical protein HS104_27190 [Polyangiaceae bacterium]|nr:hypothetical protein [Polyangiaceae bacterium]MCL4756377.1 hypothetical protein [Myxococcales bacterium]
MSRRSQKTDGRIYGPEPWAVVRGVELCHWDLWFLVVICDLSGGKRELVALLEGHRRCHDAEAKLSHLLDLETRLTAGGVSHDEVLDGVTVDRALLRKARNKVIEQSAWRPTKAMIDTPRKLLRDRAMRGHWAKFPVDPATCERAFDRFCRPEGDYGWRFTPLVAHTVERTWSEERLRAESAAGRVAADRATMTRIIDLMEHVDDSMADMSTVFEDVLAHYVAEVWDAGLDPEVALRDGIELGVWEDYGLTDDMRPFLRSIKAAHVEPAIQLFSETTAELFINGLERPFATAHAMWATLLVANSRFAEFEGLALRFGPDAWRPVIELAETAVRAGRRDVALAVFAAVNRPGPRREQFQEKCRELTGENAPPYVPRARPV